MEGILWMFADLMLCGVIIGAIFVAALLLVLVVAAFLSMFE